MVHKTLLVHDVKSLWSEALVTMFRHGSSNNVVRNNIVKDPVKEIMFRSVY